MGKWNWPGLESWNEKQARNINLSRCLLVLGLPVLSKHNQTQADASSSKSNLACPTPQNPSKIMSTDASKPPKLVLDEFIATGLSATPEELHPFFESFRTLHTRKCAFHFFALDIERSTKDS